MKLKKVKDGTETTYDIEASLDKLSGIEANAEVNQNAFSKVAVGSTTIEADNKTDKLIIEAGDNITLTPDTTNDKITIAAKVDMSALDGKLDKTGGTLTGNLTGKYITGTWLQTTAATDLNSTPPKVAVLDNSGWIYSRTPKELKSDMGLSNIFISQTILPKGWDIKANSSRGGQIEGTFKGYEGYFPILTSCYCINNLYIGIINSWITGSYDSSDNGYKWHIDARNFASSLVTADFSIKILWIKSNLFG